MWIEIDADHPSPDAGSVASCLSGRGDHRSFTGWLPRQRAVLDPLHGRPLVHAGGGPRPSTPPTARARCRGRPCTGHVGAGPALPRPRDAGAPGRRHALQLATALRFRHALRCEPVPGDLHAHRVLRRHRRLPLQLWLRADQSLRGLRASGGPGSDLQRHRALSGGLPVRLDQWLRLLVHASLPHCRRCLWQRRQLRLDQRQLRDLFVVAPASAPRLRRLNHLRGGLRGVLDHQDVRAGAHMAASGKGARPDQRETSSPRSIRSKTLASSFSAPG